MVSFTCHQCDADAEGKKVLLPNFKVQAVNPGSCQLSQLKLTLMLGQCKLPSSRQCVCVLVAP